MNRVAFVAIGVALLCFGACKKDEKSKKEPAPAPLTTAPKEPEAPKADPKLVERGAYLANLGGCVLCHTGIGARGPDMDNAWAGGLEIKEAFGTWRSPNITQSKDHGIGGWTDEQILAAIREGKRPDGDGLYPIMPYMFFNRLSDDDGKALVAFLRTIPAIEKKVERLELPLPKVPAPPPSGAPDPADDEVKHGEYLATIAHCVMCHTAMDDKGAPDMKNAFAGGFAFEAIPPFGTGTVYSPNITPDMKHGIGKWSEADIVGAIKGMKRPDGRPILFPMVLYAQTWVNITDEDAMAIAKYLKSVPANPNKVPKGTFKPMMPPGKGPPPK